MATLLLIPSKTPSSSRRWTSRCRSTPATTIASCSSPPRRRVRRASARSPASPSTSACPAAPAAPCSKASRAASPARPTPTPAASLLVEVTEHPDECRSTAAPAISSASTAPRSRRSSSCAATTGASPPGSAPISEPGALADTSGYSPDLTFEQKLDILQTIDVTERLEKALALQRERLAELQVRRKIRDDVEDGVGKQQREYVLRKQMESIRRELGEDDGSIVDEYRKKIEDAGMPDEVREQAERELGRLERMGEGSGEGNDGPDLPGLADRRAVEQELRGSLDPVAHARGARRRPRRPRRRQGPHRRVRRGQEAARPSATSRPTSKSGAILTLIGPPGTGKTSIGESIARAMGREFVRMSLGGVRDEAEIRGHRRTYIGALPGRLVRALRDAGR